MKVIHITPTLTDEDKKRKQEEAARLFVRIYEERFGSKSEKQHGLQPNKL